MPITTQLLQTRVCDESEPTASTRPAQTRLSALLTCWGKKGDTQLEVPSLSPNSCCLLPCLKALTPLYMSRTLTWWPLPCPKGSVIPSHHFQWSHLTHTSPGHHLQRAKQALVWAVLLTAVFKGSADFTRDKKRGPQNLRVPLEGI